MKKLSTCVRVATVYGLVATLLGCGGGSSSSTPPAQNAVTVGQQNGAYGAVGQSVSVSWSNTQDVACTGSGALAGTLSASGTQAVTLTTEGATTFTVTCGNASQSATITTLPQYTVIPDPVFEQALVAMGIDDVVDGHVLTANILKVTKMAILGGSGYQQAADVKTAATGNAYITSATGLENFRNLTYLRFEQQKVAAFDLSTLTELTWLSLWQEPITAIDLSHNTALETLGLSETSLTSVDVSMFPDLSELDLQNAEGTTLPYTTPTGAMVQGLTSIDVSKNPKLGLLDVSANRLTTLDVSHNPVLQTIWGEYNDFTSLNFSGMASLHQVEISNNSDLIYLNLTGTGVAKQGGQLSTGNSPKLLQITVDNGAVSAAWCTATPTFAYASSGVCQIDSTTTFISGS